MSAISVIIPYFDRLPYIGRAVESVLIQDGADVQVVIVDDGSSVPLEEKRSVIPSLADRRVSIIRQKNLGPSAARNAGLEAATSEYVLFLDSDDYLESDAVSKLIFPLETAHHDAAVGGWRNFHSSGVLNVTIPAAHYADALANSVQQGWVIGCALMRKDGACRFNLRRMPWEVAEFYFDYLQNPDRTVAFIPTPVVNMRQDAPERLTDKHNHFEPAMSGRFWCEMKSKLQQSSKLSLERASALDYRILSNIQVLLRENKDNEARELAENVSWTWLPQYEWYHFGSFAWSCNQAGLDCGGKLFLMVNNLLGRV